jgi:glyoxylase-like metal-dependent hydrolase (beta-lactamase superfamily II)
VPLTRRTPLALALLALAAVAVALPAGRAQDAGADRARGAVDRALAALGGAGRVAAIATWTIEGRGRENLSAESQGLEPGAPTWRPHAERVAVDAARLSVAWERRTERVDRSLRDRRFIWHAESTGVFDHVAGRGAMRATPVPEPRRAALARRVPHLALLEAAGAARLDWQGEARIDGRPHDEVTAVLAGGARVTLAIGRDPAVLRRLTYRAELPGRGEVEVEWHWTGWASDAAAGLAPRAHEVRIGGATFQEVAYDRFSIEARHAAALLALPPPAQAAPMAHAPADTSAGLPERGEIAPGVHVLEVGSFTVMAVVFRDFVVALEAPENHPGFEAIPAARDTTGVSRAFLGEIARLAPGRPLRYVVASHHHSDHMGGLGAFADAGATAIVAPGHAAAARTAIAAWRARHGDGGARAGAKPRIETVRERRVISDGEHRLEIVNVGASPHTGECLFAWLPRERVIFQGDLFYHVAGGAFPPPGRATMNRFFAEWLRAHDLRPRAIYGVHDHGPAGAALLEKALTGS